MFSVIWDALDAAIAFFVCLFNAFIAWSEYWFRGTFVWFANYATAIIDGIALGLLNALPDARTFDTGYWAEVADYMAIGNEWLPLAEAFAMAGVFLVFAVAVYAVRIVLLAIPTVW